MPGIGDDQRLGLFVQIQIDARIERHCLERVVGERQMPQLVQSVRRVRNQLAKKYFRVGVKRVDDELEQLVDFCLKFPFGHSYSFTYGFIIKARHREKRAPRGSPSLAVA